MSDILAAQDWLTSVLKADSALAVLTAGKSQVYLFGSVPTTAAFPYVLIQPPNDAQDQTFLGGHRFLNTQMWVVSVVGRGQNTRPAHIAYDRVDELIANKKGVSLSGSGMVRTCTRQSHFSRPEVLSTGETEQNVGGVYKINARKAP